MPKPEDRKSQNRLLHFFGLAPTKDKNKDSVLPAKPLPKDAPKERLSTKPRPSKLPPVVDRLWKWFVDNNLDNNESLKDRLIRYNDVDYAVLNSGIMSMVLELYADEAVQADSQDSLISVEALAPVKKEIERLLNAWGFDQPTVRSIAYNLVAYGDSFSINSTKGAEGISDITHVDPRDIKSKMEFKLSEIAKMKRGTHTYAASINKRLDSITAALKGNTTSVSELYKSYILGYELEIGEVLPPWNVSHFKLETTKSEFFPYGKSLMINSIALFKQYQTSKNLEALLRAAKFPKEHFEVEVDQEASELEAWEKVNEAREEWENLGVMSKDKEGFGAGTTIWTPKGLLAYSVIDSNINLDQIKDLELLRDELIMSTRVPKGYLVVDRGAFGSSGQALLQQFKPFGRSVFSVQSVILKEISQMIRIHFMMTGQFQEELTEFTLGLNFPVTEEASDRSRAKSDSLRLANDILSNIQSALGTRDGLPPDVVKSVFAQYSFLDSDDVDDWINTAADALDLNEEACPLIMYEEVSKEESKKLRAQITKEIYMESYLKSLSARYIQEGLFNQNHFVNSTCSISKNHKQVLDYLRVEKKIISSVITG